MTLLTDEQLGNVKTMIGEKKEPWAIMQYLQSVVLGENPTAGEIESFALGYRVCFEFTQYIIPFVREGKINGTKNFFN